MTLQNRIGFVHDLHKVMNKFGVKFSYDEVDETWYTFNDDPGDPQVLALGDRLTVSIQTDWPKQETWDVDLGLGYYVEQCMADKILEGKIKFVNAEDPENKSLWVSPESQRAYIRYRIDKDENGQWLASASATLRESIDRSKPAYSWKRETREFPISDELFYELLAEAEKEVG